MHINTGKQKHVLVVGLGIYGSAALWQGAEAGMKMTGVDMHGILNKFGSSHDAIRMVRFANMESIKPRMYQTESAKLGMKMYEDASRRPGVSGFLKRKYGTSRLIVRNGVTMLGPKKPHMDFAMHGVPDPFHQTIRVAEEFNRISRDQDIRIAGEKVKIDFDIHKGMRMVDENPQLNIPKDQRDELMTYQEYFSGAMYMERCVEANIYMAEAAGANVSQDKVREIQKRGNMFEVTFEDGDSMMVDDVIVAAGPWTNDFLGSSLQGNIESTKQFTAWYKVKDPKKHTLDKSPNLVFFMLNGDFVYCFASDGGIMKTAHELGGQVDPHNYIPDVATEEQLKTLYEMTARHHKNITPEAVKSSTCLYTMFKNTVGFIGRDQDTGVIVVQACNGDGAKHAAARMRWIINDISGRARNDNDHRDLGAYSASQLKM